jgi:RsiW-degrading membrane proteinase PrsW (M82 family)
MQSRSNFDHRGNILPLFFSGIGILVLLSRGIYLIASGINDPNPRTAPDLAASILGGISMLYCSGLLLPTLVFALKRLRGQTILPITIRQIKLLQLVVLVPCWGLIVLIGTGISSYLDNGWIVAAPLFLLGATLPILIIVWIGIGGLIHNGSRRRLWTTFGYGLAGSTLIAVVLEYLIIGIAAMVIGFLSLGNPELQSNLEQVKTLLVDARSGDMQTLLVNLTPAITNPLVIISILFFAAILAPLIEETVKPAIIWFMGNRLNSPAEGFVLGSLCGAGFAMMEGLLAAGSSTGMLGLGLVGRAAASLMHITASGIAGWGIASAQINKRHGFLVLTYILSVSIHGLWNGSAIMAVYGALRVMSWNMQIDFLGGSLIMGGLGTLMMEFFLMCCSMPLINRFLHQRTVPVKSQLQSDIIAPLTTSISREINGMDS